MRESRDSQEPWLSLYALIHRSPWKEDSPKLNFRFTEFSEVEVAGRRSYVNLAEPYRSPAYSVALRWVSQVGGNGIVDVHPRLGAITPQVHLRSKPRRVVQRPCVEPLHIRRRNYLAHDGRAAL